MMWNPVDNTEGEFPWKKYNNSFIELIRSNMIEKNLLPITTTPSRNRMGVLLDTPEGVKVGDWIVLKSQHSIPKLMYLFETASGRLHGYTIPKLMRTGYEIAGLGAIHKDRQTRYAPITEFINLLRQTKLSPSGTQIKNNWYSPIQVWKVDFNMGEVKFINWFTDPFSSVK